MLNDYVEHGTRAADDGARELAFEREIEYRIYRSLPTTSLSGLAPQVRVPVGFLAGTRSRELRNAGEAATRRLVGERWAWVEGSHLFPMERPQDTAAAIEAMLKRIAPAAAEADARAGGRPRHRDLIARIVARRGWIGGFQGFRAVRGVRGSRRVAVAAPLLQGAMPPRFSL
nr:hypothetical protein [Lysobacter enzymogenes]